MFGVLDNWLLFGQNWQKLWLLYSDSQIDTQMMPNMPYGIMLLISSSNLFILEHKLSLGASSSGTACHDGHVLAQQKSNCLQRATRGGRVALGRVMWILMRTFPRFKWSGWSGFCSLMCLLLPPIKGRSFQPRFINWMKQDRIILLTDGIKINSCELWGPLNVYVLTHTHTHCLPCYCPA